MWKLFLFIFLSSFSFDLFAIGSGSSRPDSQGNEYACGAFEIENENHNSGHLSCASCLDSHESCEMRCYHFQFTCNTSGYNTQNQMVIVYGFRENTKRMAELNALNQCRLKGLRNCNIYGRCLEHSQLDVEDSYLCGER